MRNLVQSLEIVIDCLEKIHRETKYQNEDAARSTEKKLGAARRSLKEARISGSVYLAEIRVRSSAQER